LIAPIQEHQDRNIKEIAAIKRRARIQFEAAGMPLVTDEEREVYMNAPCIDKVDEMGAIPEGEKYIHEPQRPFVTVGFCPKCTSRMVGEVVPLCETEESGRHFYSECTACTYYTEIFKGRKGRYIEMKGE
jgi:formate dehydrogenase maturation protein FdhE